MSDVVVYVGTSSEAPRTCKSKGAESCGLGKHASPGHGKARTIGGGAFLTTVASAPSPPFRAFDRLAPAMSIFAGHIKHLVSKSIRQKKETSSGAADEGASSLTSPRIGACADGRVGSMRRLHHAFNTDAWRCNHGHRIDRTRSRCATGDVSGNPPRMTGVVPNFESGIPTHVRLPTCLWLRTVDTVSQGKTQGPHLHTYRLACACRTRSAT